MDEKLIFEHNSPDIVVTTERILAVGRAIPASTIECTAVYSSTGLVLKKNELYIAYSQGDNVYRQANRIDYTMTLKYPPSQKSEMLSEYGVSLFLVTTSLAKDQMKNLSEKINEAVKKAKAWKRLATEEQMQSEVAAIKNLGRI